MSYSGQIWKPPVNTSFTTLNTGSLLKTSTVGNSTAIEIGPASSGDNAVGQYIAAPSTPYQVIFNISLSPGDMLASGYTQGTLLFGGGWYDGTKLVTLFVGFNTSAIAVMNAYEWSTTTNIASNVFGSRQATGYPTSTINWFMLRDDGTNINFYISTDGPQQSPIHWQKAYSQARTTYLSAPTYVGWFADPNSSSSFPPTYLTLNSFQSLSL